jgi:molybdopterin/thiamine biosynthesis adenylyltransferase
MNSKIVIIGCGGIGSHLIPPLLRYVETLKTTPEVVLVDGDTVSESNLGRQEFGADAIGINKAMAIYKKLSDYDLQFSDEYVGKNNVDSLIEDGDIVMLCVDNHVCRKIVSQHCETLDSILLISGGNELTDGNVQAYVKQGGKELTQKMGERHPEILTANDGDRAEMSCEALAKLPSGGQIIATNFAAASLMLQFLYLSLTEDPKYCEVYFDITSLASRGVENDS